MFMHCLAFWMNFLDRWTKKGQQVLAFKSFLYYCNSNLMIVVEKMNWFLQGGIEGSCRLLLASEFCVSKCNCGKVLSGNFLLFGIPEFCISVMTFCGRGCPPITAFIQPNTCSTLAKTFGQRPAHLWSRDTDIICQVLVLLSIFVSSLRDP